MMLNHSWLGNCLGIMDIRLLVARLKRFLLGSGSRAIALGRQARGLWPDELGVALKKRTKSWRGYAVSSCWILDFGFISCTVRVPACSRWFLILRLVDVTYAI